MKNIRPLGNRLLVKRSKAEKSQGGIILPDSAQEKPKEGVVIARGPGAYNDEGELESMDVQVGDRVLFTSYAGTSVKQGEGDDECLILSANDVLAILV